ncbi:MAG: Uma2 family endonuclease [Saprospiraceae bacterium]
MTATTLPLSPALSKTRRYTVAEYLEIERSTGEKHTFINGRLFPMAGGTINHNRITLNISVQLSDLLFDRTELEVFNNETKIYLPALQIYHYPDAVVVTGEPLVAQEEVGAILNPILIVEVLSDSTGRFDRFEKFTHYQTLPSFREYVLIHQDRPQIDSFLRQEEPDLWRSSEVSGLDSEIHFQSIGVKIALSKIYRNVSFETAE